MAKFKVGDIIRCRKEVTSYGVTDHAALCKVLHSEGFVRAQIIASKRDPGRDASYDVTESAFELATDADYKEFGIKKESNMKMVSSVTEYVEKHKDVLFTVALVLILDHYVFEGKFRQRVEDMVEGFLKKAGA